MVTPPRAARIREHEDALDVIHESRRFGEVRRARAVFDHQAVAFADDAARATCYFRDHVRAKALHDSIERTSDGVFIEVNRWPKKRCLALSKADRAADFACPFSVPVSPVMLAARIAASRLLWMMLKAPA